MNAPIPVSEALRLLSMAIEDCDKATEREWPVYEPEDDDDPDIAVFVRFSFLARATMRPMLSAIRELVSLDDGFRRPICVTDHIYPPLAALRDHYDSVRPGWRTE